MAKRRRKSNNPAGRPSKGLTERQAPLRMPAVMLGVVDEMAAREGVSREEWIRRAIRLRLGWAEVVDQVVDLETPAPPDLRRLEQQLLSAVRRLWQFHRQSFRAGLERTYCLPDDGRDVLYQVPGAVLNPVVNAVRALREADYWAWPEVGEPEVTAKPAPPRR